MVATGLAVGLCIFAGLLFDYAFYPHHSKLPGKQSGNRGENGIWLHYSWYFGEHSDGETERLARELAERQVTYAYFHVRYIGKSGKLRFRFPKQARHLNVLVRAENPDVKRIAWIYVGNTRGMGSIADLSDPAHRGRLVEEARFLVTDCGFDGVQWDYEICPDNDAGLLSLLDETRAVLPKGSIVSIATALWSPALPRATGYGWSEAYFAEVAKRTDQICVMGYDSGLYLPRAYAWLMEEQVVRVCRAVSESGAECQVLIGVPTYGAGGPSHHERAENLMVAIRGLRAGVARLSPRERETFAGIALFADYTTDADEWETYGTDWLNDTDR
jgi:spore germination protein YaaH